MTERIVLIGAGHLGGAFLSGIRASELSITLAARNIDHAKELNDKWNLLSVPLEQALPNATLVVIAVKPYQVNDLLAKFENKLSPEAIILSLVGGFDLSSLSALLPAGQPILRAMTNTPMEINQGVIGLSRGQGVRDKDYEITANMLNKLGEVYEIPESLQGAFTALAGSAPAYFFLVAEAMIDAGVHLGFSRQLATRIVCDTAAGSGALLKYGINKGRDAVDLRAEVTSPAGSTERAITQLEHHGIRAAFLKALQAVVYPSSS